MALTRHRSEPPGMECSLQVTSGTAGTHDSHQQEFGWISSRFPHFTAGFCCFSTSTKHRSYNLKVIFCTTSSYIVLTFYILYILVSHPDQTNRQTMFRSLVCLTYCRTDKLMSWILNLNLVQYLNHLFGGLAKQCLQKEQKYIIYYCFNLNLPYTPPPLNFTFSVDHAIRFPWE